LLQTSKRSFSSTPLSLAPLNNNKNVLNGSEARLFSKQNLLKHFTVKNVCFGLFVIILIAVIRASGVSDMILI